MDNVEEMRELISQQYIRVLPNPVYREIENRIDSKNNTGFVRPRCYKDNYLLQKLWKNLGNKTLKYEQRMSSTIMNAQNNANDLICYTFTDGSMIYPISGEQIGTWCGVGVNDDFQKPIEAIEIFRQKSWTKDQYSIKICFSSQTFLITSKTDPDNTSDTKKTTESEDLVQEAIKSVTPCGLEIFTSDHKVIRI